MEGRDNGSSTDEDVDKCQGSGDEETLQESQEFYSESSDASSQQHLAPRASAPAAFAFALPGTTSRPTGEGNKRRASDAVSNGETPSKRARTDDPHSSAPEPLAPQTISARHPPALSASVEATASIVRPTVVYEGDSSQDNSAAFDRKMARSLSNASESSQVSEDGTDKVHMTGLYSVETGDWKGTWHSDGRDELSSKFRYKAGTVIDHKMPCSICNVIDDEEALYCDLCDRGFHFACLKIQEVPKARHWYCDDCQPVKDTWGLMPCSRLYTGTFDMKGAQKQKEQFYLSFSYRKNRSPAGSAVDENAPVIRASAKGYGHNGYGSFLMTGCLDVFVNINAGPLKGLLWSLKHTGRERFFFKLSVTKQYCNEVDPAKFNVSNYRSSMKALRETPPPPMSSTQGITSPSSPGESYTNLRRESFNLRGEIEKLKRDKDGLRRKAREAENQKELMARQHERDMARLEQSLRSAKQRLREANGGGAVSPCRASAGSGSMAISSSMIALNSSQWQFTRPRTLIFTDVDCYFHMNPSIHLESQSRLTGIWGELNKSFGFRLEWISNVNRVNLQTLLLAHDLDYIQLLFDTCKQLSTNTPRNFVKAQQKALTAGAVGKSDGDTYVSSNGAGNTVSAALKSSGAVCDAIDKVMTKGPGRDASFSNAFCVIRPPGHHAGRCGVPSGELGGCGMAGQGFCILNNVAIGALHAMCRLNLRVAIVDIDLHAGNGTQEILELFLRDHDEFQDRVLFSSIHSGNVFPQVSDKRKVPSGVRAECFQNVSIMGKCTSEEWRKRFAVGIEPALRNFRPELIIISAGFDAHKHDKINDFIGLGNEDYFWVAKTVGNICKNIVSVLEGGYDPSSLPGAVSAHVEGLII
jgi:acetoin utilization deacetylase AcuC-like enzyme|eukprot:g798.t1